MTALPLAHPPPVTDPVGDFAALPRWFGPADRPVLGWLSVPPTGAGDSGVLVLPPVGYPYWSAHRTLRVLAERLAAAGHLALRIDYDGTGDSAGDQWDPDRLAAWRESVRLGAQELRALGVRELRIVGARLGGTLALLEADALDAEEVVAWEPVERGRRYAREIKLLSTPVPSEHADGDPGVMVEAGSVFAAQTLADLGALDLEGAMWPPPRRVTIIGGDDTLAEVLRARGVEVHCHDATGGEAALETPAEYAGVAEEVVAAVCAALGSAGPATAPHPLPRPTGRLVWEGVELEEEVLVLGPRRLVGVFTHDPAAGSSAPVTVFLNSGSEPHVGPGRAWVEYARGLAARGLPCLRVDFRGWGESPDDGHAPGRPYDPHGEEDARAVVDALHDRGHDRAVLAGLCAGAWIALRTALHEPVAGVVALNPQFYWRPGDPVEATMAETHERREPDRAREARGARLGVWSVLDRLGHRPWAGRWLDALRTAGVPVLLLFAEGDEGLGYLRTRLPRRLARTLRDGRVTLAEVPEIDHSMHRAWLRAGMLARLEDFISSL